MACVTTGDFFLFLPCLDGGKQRTATTLHLIYLQRFLILQECVSLTFLFDKNVITPVVVVRGISI